MASHPKTLGTDTPPNLKLTLAWNHETFDVPAPAGVPPEMRATKDYATWWRIGNVRQIRWTDMQGRTYVAEAWARATDEHGTLGPIIPFVSRYRPDGTREVKSATVPSPTGGFATWTVYAPDGKTPPSSPTATTPPAPSPRSSRPSNASTPPASKPARTRPTSTASSTAKPSSAPTVRSLAPTARPS
jgi:hypothetical protein